MGRRTGIAMTIRSGRWWMVADVAATLVCQCNPDDVVRDEDGPRDQQDRVTESVRRPVDGSVQNRQSIASSPDQAGVEGEQDRDRQYEENDGNHHRDLLFAAGFQELPFAQGSDVSGLGA